MRVVCDVETNGLYNPTKIWVVVCKDIDTGQVHIFRETDNVSFLAFAKGVDLWIGHNFLSYDLPVLRNLWGLHPIDIPNILDTFILSKMVDYPREGHSVENYGEEFGLEKIIFTDFSKYSVAMEEYCTRDVEITHRIYLKYLKYINTPIHREAITLEHSFTYVCYTLSKNGFFFNRTKASNVLEKVLEKLKVLDKDILQEFPPVLRVVRVITPKATKFGTISLSNIPKVLRDKVHLLKVDVPFKFCKWEVFNPASHKQVVDVLTTAGWSPVEKTDTHKETERELNSLTRLKKRSSELDSALQVCQTKILGLRRYGWKISEDNLSTLPASAPSAARTLAQRILWEARRRTLTEWLGLVNPDTGRVHGTFQGIGSWPHRMAHQKPNMANIPNEFKEDGSKKLLGKEFRSLWIAPKNRLLVGVDAESIQLRIFAHMVNDTALINAIVNGRKEDKTDPHNYNMGVLGDVCRTRLAAKRFLYALFLGAGLSKLAFILGSSEEAARSALDRLLQAYPGFELLKREVIPADARRGWFTGLDGRSVRILGDTLGERKHLCMSGYLQNGESIIMKRATLKWVDKLPEFDSMLINLVHDEWQVECPNDMSIALKIADMMADSLREVGEELNLHCPLSGSYQGDHGLTIGINWYQTH